MNPYSDWVINRLYKIIKKRKKLPFGNFLGKPVTFLVTFLAVHSNKRAKNFTHPESQLNLYCNGQCIRIQVEGLHNVLSRGS